MRWVRAYVRADVHVCVRACFACVQMCARALRACGPWWVRAVDGCGGCMRAGMRAGVGWVGMRAGGHASEHASGYASGGWWMSMCVRAYFQAGKRARAGRGKSQPPVCQPLADGRLGTCGHVRARASTCARAHACTSGLLQALAPALDSKGVSGKRKRRERRGRATGRASR